jgi:predicted nuclease of restriction endonuclease-like (RecB) superfamily
MTKSLQAPPGYADLLADIKTRVRTAQVRAAFAVSRELILLYWSIGRDILNRQQAEGWGAKVIERLAKDLGIEFPGVEGFSSRNLKYMRSLAEAWPEAEIVPQLVALLPWGHLRVLLDRLKDRETREWYLRAAVEYGWSRNILVHQISSRLHEREGKALTNFQQTLPPPDSDLAVQILKDPYNFDFLTPDLQCTGAGAGTRFAPPSSRPSSRTGSRVRFRRQPVPAQRGRRNLLSRPALLPRPSALLFRNRVEGRPLQA